MKLDRLLDPRSVAVVGASQRLGTYGNQTLANLVEAGFGGPVWGVHPTATKVHGVPCFRTLADLPEVPDVAVIATPASTVPGLLDEAGELGVGGTVVFAAGFAEVAHGRALQEELRAAALRHSLPVCGPNGNGIVSLHRRAPLWGDAYHLGEPGRVAVVSQSGNVAVNALGTRRGLRLHTVVSCGNQAVLDAADYLTAIAELDGVRAVALYLESDGDGDRLALALKACAERDIGLAVLKAGRSALGASSAAAHTGAVASDSRILQALVEEAGGAWVDDPHDLLEVAKSMAVATRKTGGVGIVTCSGGDAATGADLAASLGIDLPPLHDGDGQGAGVTGPRSGHDREPAGLHGPHLGSRRTHRGHHRDRGVRPWARTGGGLPRPAAGHGPDFRGGMGAGRWTASRSARSGPPQAS